MEDIIKNLKEAPKNHVEAKEAVKGLLLSTVRR